jgi:hypothetical protein
MTQSRPVALFNLRSIASTVCDDRQRDDELE